MNTINENKKLSTKVFCPMHITAVAIGCCHNTLLEKDQKLSVKIVYKSCQLKHLTIMIMKRPKSIEL